MRTWPSISAAVLVVASLAACSSDKSDGSADHRAGTVAVAEPPAVTATPSVDQIAGLSLPIEAYMPTAEEIRVTSSALTKVVNECMRSFGFAYQQPVPPVHHMSLLTSRYGVTDPVAAAQYGYHAPPGDPAAAAAEKPAGDGGQLSAAEQVVFNGYPDDKAKDAANKYNGKPVPAGGCVGEGRRKSKSDAIDDADPDGIVIQIASASEKQSETDARVVAVFQKWSACMAEKGYQYKIPVGMADNDPELAKSFNAPTASPREIQTAVTDVACKKKNNVVGVWLAVETAYQKVLIQRNQERLTAVRKAIDDAARASAAYGG